MIRKRPIVRGEMNAKPSCRGDAHTRPGEATISMAVTMRAIRRLQRGIVKRANASGNGRSLLTCVGRNPFDAVAERYNSTHGPWASELSWIGN